ncbi:hypothetical protein [Granulicella arctica]|uniref:DUF4105 domain-containing protein n=1 Tax=Granulicella arctica TaxID=940613 RepID=A0A7Y9TFV6_9BACT|nr:hypothetical protein [Granulicella arctica]NYF78759.1 hypothetical protein [Granulicella arctica]
MRTIRTAFAVFAMLMVAMSGVRAYADAALLMEEPYGEFGAMNPTGHAAVYLNHVCAESPTHLRLCRPGEPGAVISRYHKIDGYDWLAIPLVPYLYAVETVQDVPANADAALEATLRNEYRRNHLLAYAPDVATGPKAGEDPKGDWTQLVGASYDRRIYGFQVQTTAEEDERFIAEFNDRRNVSHFNLLFHNCADFSRVLLNIYYPHAVHRNFFVDLGLTTPKQVARSLTKYAKDHPEVDFSTFMVPQVPGSIKRSHPIDGVLESVVKSKKYVVPLAVLNPELTAGLVVAYLTDGRFHAPKDAQPVMLPGEQEHPAEMERSTELQRRAPASELVHGVSVAPQVPQGPQ